MRSRYDLAQNSTTKSEEGTHYKDIFTIPIQKFQYTESYHEYVMSSKDIERPDLFVNKFYTMSEFDDLLFLINNIGLIYEKESGDDIKIPTLDNLEEFYYNRRV